MDSSGGPSKRRIGVNAMSVFGGDALNKASVFFVYMFVARNVGVHEFGQLSLGLLLLYTFQVLAVAGLPVALTRWVARRPRYSTHLLHQGYLASTIPASLGILGMCGLALLMNYERATTEIIAILSLAIPIYAMTVVTESVIKGREQMHLIPLGNVSGNLLLVVGSSVCLLLGWGVHSVAVTIVISRVTSLVSMHLLFRRYIDDCRQRFRGYRTSLRLLRKSIVFFGTDGLQAISSSLFALLLSKFATETEVGLLAASFQLLQPFQMAYRSVGHSLFPPLVNAAKSGEMAVSRLVRITLMIMLRLAVPASLTVFCLAGDMLQLAYGGEDFQRSVAVLKILAFTLLFMPLNPVLGHALWAMNFEKSVLRIVSINFAARVVVGLVLIPTYGLVGAAISALVCCVINTIQHYLTYCQRISKLQLWCELRQLLPAVSAALACVILLPIHIYASLLVGLMLYAALSLGSEHQFSLLTRLVRRSTESRNEST